MVSKPAVRYAKIADEQRHSSAEFARTILPVADSARSRLCDGGSIKTHGQLERHHHGVPPGAAGKRPPLLYARSAAPSAVRNDVEHRHQYW